MGFQTWSDRSCWCGMFPTDDLIRHGLDNTLGQVSTGVSHGREPHRTWQGLWASWGLDPLGRW
jgi:hypothetical protein